MAHILVVEDNRTNLDLMLYLLRAFGHTAVGFSDGISGLKTAQEDVYDLVLADILMPGIDGYEFARRFQAQREPRIKLLAVTALAMVSDRERILAAGFDGYLSKPIDPQNFVSEVEAFLPRELRSTPSTGLVPTATSEPHAPTQGPVILIVDDTPVNLDVIRGTLTPFGYYLLEAHNANEAFAQASCLKPALILCDLHMPNGDGFEFIQRVKADQELQNVPFIFLSSTAWLSSDRLHGMKLGAKKFILRPIDPQRLLAEVRSSLQAQHV